MADRQQNLADMWRDSCSHIEHAGQTIRPISLDKTPDTLSGGVTNPGTLSGEPTSGGRGSASEQTPSTAIASTHFKIETAIGRGGMGVVYRGKQTSLNRDIAIKHIAAQVDSAHVRSGFISEALVTGFLDHPNIVPVHELGTDENGSLFLAMKLVGGVSWRDLLHPKDKDNDSALTLDKNLEIIDAVGNALSFAHAKDIIHRDIKPENIMVGEFGEVLLMDWGLALDIAPEPRPDARAPHRSTAHAVAGTPAYIAPEMAAGEHHQFGPATDCFLLGACLFEVLTGKPPHSGDTALATILAAGDYEGPELPDHISPALQTICRKALAAKPTNRYDSIQAFQHGLRAYRTHRESEAAATAAQEAARTAQRIVGSPDQRESAYAQFAQSLAGF